jgi:hypothetical protein
MNRILLISIVVGLKLSFADNGGFTTGIYIGSLNGFYTKLIKF